MTKAEKRLDAIRNNPNDVRFEDLCGAAVASGFVHVRTNASHRIYRHPDHPEEMLNLQPGPNGKAKPYQVIQFLKAHDRLFPEQDL